MRKQPDRATPDDMLKAREVARAARQATGDARPAAPLRQTWPATKPAQDRMVHRPTSAR